MQTHVTMIDQRITGTPQGSAGALSRARTYLPLSLSGEVLLGLRLSRP